METKILNKKVGCALIAAGLLAASSVQGSESSVSDIQFQQIVKYMGVQDNSGRQRFSVEIPIGYDLRRKWSELDGNETVQIIMVQDGASDVFVSAFVREGLPGFLSYNEVIEGIQVTIVVPLGFVPIVREGGRLFIVHQMRKSLENLFQLYGKME
jgi:hypothetical protein